MTTNNLTDLSPEAAGLPDNQTLTKLAAEFFNQLPGEHPNAEKVLPIATDSFNQTSIDSLANQAKVASQAASLPNFDQGTLSNGLQALLAQSISPSSANKVGEATLKPAYYFINESPSQPAVSAQIPVSNTHQSFDVQAIRRDFPILKERVNGHPLVWFDNAATTQKPQVVIDRISQFYQRENSNIHRAAHELAARATDAYEEARDTIASFLNAASSEEIVFVRGSTEAINLVAQSFGRQNIGEGDEIIVSHLEHHANIVPWKRLCDETGAQLRVIPVDDSGQVILSEYQKLLSDKTKLVSFTQVANALGTITPAQEIIAMAKRVGAVTLLDAAQSVSHLAVDVQQLDCDFLVFSGHKIFGPTGIGVLYGKQSLLDETQPWQAGGNMIEDVTFEQIRYQGAPAKFEAGTGNIADAVGLSAAIKYVQSIGLSRIAQYEHELLGYATQAIQRVNGVKLIGTATDKTSVMSFTLEGYENAAVGKALNEVGIAVRTGHHCAQPILRRFGVESTVRPSFAFYNTFDEIDLLVDTVNKLSINRRF
ncbi:MAG: family 2A encapsulin nanocompartment cargo protein cysteine desulfurase [Gammaproteobacteria bacterium]|nr:family 2A encapsulin nanocompartment cargo protein cysteine desulfurase [Gammaproteobacteria bacterium]